MDFGSNSDNSSRSRSNTWPRIQLENAGFSAQRNHPQQGQGQGTSSSKKAFTGRRNICGMYSYADLITQAITSSPNQKLSLAQIYQWMVENVAIFKDQAENSASWKNSVRHNLSLHNKFVRIQATGNAKGSLWTIDPEAKRTKLGRRRCASIETPKTEDKRVNRADQPPNEYQGFPGYQMNTSDARYRTYSNGSTCSKLSPLRSEESLTTLFPVLNSEYQNYYSGFRQRSYSNGSFCEQNIYPHSVYRPSSYASCSSGGTVTQDVNHQVVNQMFNDNFQNGLTMQPFAPNDNQSYLNAGPYVLERPKTLVLNESSEDINNIEVDTMRTPLECDVDEIIEKELTIEGVLDFDF